jgi:hypothetical protein
MKIKESLINPYNKPKFKILIKYTLLLSVVAADANGVRARAHAAVIVADNCAGGSGCGC